MLIVQPLIYIRECCIDMGPFLRFLCIDMFCIEINLSDYCLTLDREEKKRLELEIAALKDTVQSLHLQLVNAEDALVKEKTLNLTNSKGK